MKKNDILCKTILTASKYKWLNEYTIKQTNTKE